MFDLESTLSKLKSKSTKDHLSESNRRDRKVPGTNEPVWAGPMDRTGPVGPFPVFFGRPFGMFSKKWLEKTIDSPGDKQNSRFECFWLFWPWNFEFLSQNLRSPIVTASLFPVKVHFRLDLERQIFIWRWFSFRHQLTSFSSVKSCPVIGQY